MLLPLQPVHPGRDGEDHKSAQQFHERTMEQINGMKECIQEKMDQEHNDWFRASQVCAHDRKRYIAHIYILVIITHDILLSPF